MTEEQKASLQYAAEWLFRSEDISNRKHAERLRALLAAGEREGKAQPISDYMMDLVDRLGSEADAVDPRAWTHLLVYARPHMTLDKPAQVSGTRFGTGVKWSTVIGAAQRYHEFMQTPEKEALRIENARAFMESFAATPASSVADTTWETMMLSAAAKSGDPKVIELTAQLVGAGPCEACGFIKRHCRCPAPSVADAAGASETRIDELLEQHIELNLGNYTDDDVRMLNDWSIEAYTVLDAIANQLMNNMPEMPDNGEVY